MVIVCNSTMSIHNIKINPLNIQHLTRHKTINGPINNLQFVSWNQPTIATVPADEIVEPKDFVLLLPLLIIPVKSSERKEDRDWNLIRFAIALGKALVGSNVFLKFTVTSSNISGATITRSMHGFLPNLAWKTTESSAKESCEHGELLHFGGVQNIPWWRKQTHLKAWAVPSPQSSPQL